jgi:hypothetical protein
MNEKLKEIAAKAQVEHCVSHVRLQEFAELIVKECIDTMYKRGETYAHPSAGFYQAKTFSEAIIEHFGVEK